MIPEPTPPTATTAIDSPGLISAARCTAPYAVNAAQPRMAASSSAIPGGNAASAAMGTTAYSARPAIEYMASGVPSSRASRVVPS